MASEVLYVPESKLAEVIRVIRVGLVFASSHDDYRLSEETREALTAWCDAEEKYLKRTEDSHEIA